MDREELLNDPVFSKYLNRGITESTRYKNLLSMELYLEFYREKRGLNYTPRDLIEEIEKDRKKGILERGTVERAWVEYVIWMNTECEKKKPNGEPTGKHYSIWSLKGNSQTIKGFYRFYGVPLGPIAKLPRQFRGRGSDIKNRKFMYRPKHVKKLIAVCTSNRDKAIIMMLFQGGFDPATLFSLNVGDVYQQTEKGESPMVIHIQRVKVGLNYRAVIGADAVEYLKIYLRERSAKRFRCKKCKRSWKVMRHKCPNCGSGEVIPVWIRVDEKGPLFISSNRKNRLRTQDFDRLMKEIVRASGLIENVDIDKADINPGRPYALRAAFSSILKFRGLDSDVIDGLQGHKVSYGGAYLVMSDDELRMLYHKFEEYLSIGETLDVREVKEKFREDLNIRDVEIAKLQKRLQDLEGREESRAKLEAPEDPELAARLNELLSDPQVRKILERKINETN